MSKRPGLPPPLVGLRSAPHVEAANQTARGAVAQARPAGSLQPARPGAPAVPPRPAVAQARILPVSPPRIASPRAVAPPRPALVQARLAPGRRVIQMYGGTPLQSLQALLADLLQGGELNGFMSKQAVYDLVYRYYSQGPVPTGIGRQVQSDDPYGTLTGVNFGIPGRFITAGGGFIKISNPDYNTDLVFQGGYSQQRMSLHVAPEHIADAMLACYDQFRSMPQVSDFKMPSARNATLHRLDNLVIYYLDDPSGTVREEILDFVTLLGRQGWLLDEHPAMLAPTGLPGVGTGESWSSFGDRRCELIAEAYVSWNKQGGVEGFLTAALKRLEKEGYSRADLSRDATQSGGSNKCFLTTACSGALGLPDDCLELSALRWLRDGYVLKLPGGRRELEVYYDLAPAIVRALDARPDRIEVYRRIYEGLVAPVVARILEDDLAGAFRLYKRRVLAMAGSSSAGGLFSELADGGEIPQKREKTPSVVLGEPVSLSR